MLEEAEDEASLGDTEISALVATAMQLNRVGDLARARALLESADREKDEGAALLYVTVLDRLDDHAAMQTVLSGMIGRLPTGKAPSDTYLATLLRQSERGCLPLHLIDAALLFAKPRRVVGEEIAVAWHAVRRRQMFRANQAPRIRRGGGGASRSFHSACIACPGPC